MMEILFINSSPNDDGNTAKLAKKLMAGKEYKTLNLAEYRINTFGQTLAGDQFDEIIEAMKVADTIVVGSPVYWHNLSGALRVVLDRFYGVVDAATLKGKPFFFLFQGAAPTQTMLEAGNYTIGRFANMYGMIYKGMATNIDEAAQLSKKME